MIPSMFLAASLLAAPPNGNASTFIIDSAHQPAWVKVDEKEDLKIWWDSNAKSSIVFEQREYPVILLRGFSYFNNEPLIHMDTVMAVDCETNQVATMKNYFPYQKGMVAEGLKFRAWPDPDREEIHTMIGDVCGEGWAK
jgi:hypothetical protein